MASSILLSLSSILSLLFIFFVSPSSSSTSITIPLSTIPLSQSTQFTPETEHPHPWQKLNHLVSSSLARAHHLKHPHSKTTTTTTPSATKTPLFSRSYGGYSVSLSFGTPPQTIPFVMDTGSSLVWFPCTRNYTCRNCTFSNVDPDLIRKFIPKLSSSVKIVGCTNPKCELFYDEDVRSRCGDCAGDDQNLKNCTQICPAYGVQYGSGSTIGFLLLDNLDFPEKIVHDFLVGCSLFSSRQPEGIAGFGRGKMSLPSQMGVKRFSYCLLSHRFDDTTVRSDLILDGGSDSGNGKLTYTPFLKNPVGTRSSFLEYYYLTLRKITVGDKHVRVPYKFLVPGADGNGGTIVDSGTTFTFMDKPVFELVAREFETQMANYTRATDVEIQTGLRPCLDVSKDYVIFPKLIFQFKGGAKMELPLANYFSLLTSKVVCMTVITNGFINDGEMSSGPSIILGNYQQQNYFVEYDLKNEKFGFRKQICK